MIPWLDRHSPFPEVSGATPEGLLAAGGGLSVNRLVEAYSSGIFPWFDARTPILWYSPPERCVFVPGRMRVQRSLRQRMRNSSWKVTTDEAFELVIRQCAVVSRKHEAGTWIDGRIVEAYTRLHRKGFAHSFEVWDNGELIGGLYGVSLGRLFFGESMFHLKPDASKVAFYQLHQFAVKNGFLLIDAQVYNEHLGRLGGIIISREKYLQYLHTGLQSETLEGKWTL